MPRDRVLTKSRGPLVQTEGHPITPWELGQTVRDIGSTWAVSSQEAGTIMVGGYLSDPCTKYLACPIFSFVG